MRRSKDYVKEEWLLDTLKQRGKANAGQAKSGKGSTGDHSTRRLTCRALNNPYLGGRKRRSLRGLYILAHSSFPSFAKRERKGTSPVSRILAVPPFPSPLLKAHSLVSGARKEGKRRRHHTDTPGSGRRHVDTGGRTY